MAEVPLPLLPAIEPHGWKPRCVALTQSVLDTPFFYDGHRDELLRVSPQNLEPHEVPGREKIYTFTLRAIAALRRTERQAAMAEATYDAIQWTHEWELSPEKATALREANGGLVRRLGRQLIMLNNLECNHAAPLARSESLHEHQQVIFGEILDKMFRARPRPKFEGADKSASASVVITPTGGGKTAIIGEIFHKAGIGQPASLGDPGRLRAMIITTSEELTRQMLGETGANTLKRFLGDEVSVSGYFWSRKELDGDVVVINDDSFLLGMQTGVIKLDEFDIIAADEGHHLLAPQMLEKVPSLGPCLLVFTATPAYNRFRDLRHLFEVSSEKSVLQWTVDGLLNAMQIFTIQVETAEDADRLAAKLAALMVRGEGRNVAVYSRKATKKSRSRRSHHARWIAEQLQEEGIEAGTVGVFQNRSKNRRLIREFDEDKIDVITTVGKLKEGWDTSRANVIIIAREVREALELEQILGRATRPNDEFPVSIVFEITTGQMNCSVWSVYDIEEIEQGMVIGGKPASRFASRLRWLPGLKKNGRQHADRGEFKKSPRVSLASEPGPSSELSPLKFLYSSVPIHFEDLPSEAREGAAPLNYRRVRDALLVNRVQETRPPEGYISLETIAEEFNLSRVRAAYRLTVTGHHYVGVWQRHSETHRLWFDHFFEPAARSYLQTHPLPPLATEEEVTINGMATLLRVSERIVKETIDSQEIKGQERTAPSVGAHRRFTPEEFAQVAETISLTPWAELTDVLLEDLVSELDASRHYVEVLARDSGVEAKRKRFVTGLGATDISRHFAADEAQKIRAEYYKYPVAADTDVHYMEIAKEEKVDYETVRRAAHGMAEQKKVTPTLLRDPRNLRPTEYLRADDAQKIRVLVRLQPLPPHLVPQKIMARILCYSEQGVNAALLKHRDEVTKLRLPKISGQSYCFGWDKLRMLAERRPWRHDVGPIDFDMLPMTADETDPAKIEAARVLQRRFLAPETLGEGESSAAMPEPPGDSKSPLPPLEPSPVQETPARPHIRVHSMEKISLNEALDVEAIAKRASMNPREIEKIIEETRIVGSLTAQKVKRNDGTIVLRYTGLALRAICIELIGVHADAMAAYVDMPPTVIKDFLHSTHHPHTPDGRFDMEAWQAVLKEFRRPPAHHEELEVFAMSLGRDPSEVLQFVQDNGGSIETFYNEKGQKCPYLPPLSAKLVRAQNDYSIGISAPGNYLNREQIAIRSGRSAADFDYWLVGRLRSPAQIRWSRVRYGAEEFAKRKVLPHYEPKLWQAYLQECQQE